MFCGHKPQSPVHTNARVHLGLLLPRVSPQEPAHSCFSRFPRFSFCVLCAWLFFLSRSTLRSSPLLFFSLASFQFSLRLNLRTSPLLLSSFFPLFSFCVPCSIFSSRFILRNSPLIIIFLSSFQFSFHLSLRTSPNLSPLFFLVFVYSMSLFIPRFSLLRTSPLLFFSFFSSSSFQLLCALCFVFLFIYLFWRVSLF